jgi:Family of unknown function (DUF5906)
MKSTATFEEFRDEMSKFSVSRATQRKDGTAELKALFAKFNCATLPEIEDLDDSAAYARMIDHLREIDGKPPRLIPTYDGILKHLGAFKDGTCSAADKDAIYRAVLATEDLGPTQTDHIVKALKAKLPGAPSVASIRQELESVGRMAHAHKHPLPKDAELVIFRCHDDDTVYGGVNDPTTGKFVEGLKLKPIKGFTGLAQLCGLFGKPLIDPQQMPLGVFEFRPGVAPQVKKTAAGFEINTWTPPALRENACSFDSVPPTVRKLLLHVLGDDESVYKHFLNWLAVAYQTCDRTGTSWVIAGCPGTGKGILFEHVLTPLFGEDYCIAKTAQHLEEQFNGWFSKCVLLCIDEAKVAGFQAAQVEEALRRYITERFISVREMRATAVSVRNYCNVVLTSNDPRPISLPEGDRRYNVAPRQEKPLQGDMEKMIADLRSEMPRFAGYLASCKIDAEKARRPMRTEEREKTIENSASTPERIARAIKAGDLDYFLEEFWTGANGEDLFSRKTETDNVRKVLIGWAQAASPVGAKRLPHTNVPASHVAKLFNFLMPPKFERSPQEIGRALGLKANAYCDRGRAYRVTWRTKEEPAELADIIKRLETFGSVPEKDFTDAESEPAPVTEEASAAQVAPEEDTSWLIPTPIEMLRAQLDITDELAAILVKADLKTAEAIANDGGKLTTLEGIDEEVAAELRERAQAVLADAA